MKLEVTNHAKFDNPLKCIILKLMVWDQELGVLLFYPRRAGLDGVAEATAAMKRGHREPLNKVIDEFLELI